MVIKNSFHTPYNKEIDLSRVSIQQNVVINNKPHIVINNLIEVTRQDIIVLAADKPKTMKLGWTMTETIGIGVINLKGINKMQLGPPENLVHTGEATLISNSYPETFPPSYWVHNP